MKKYLITCLIFPALLYSQIRLPLEKQTPPEGTSHQEMIEYLENIVGQSYNFELEFAGYSAQERTIPVVYFPQRKHWKKHATTVMIFAQQHGNEPSGKESLLMLINELYLNPVRYDFSNLNLILVPMVNPDGNETHRRRNGNDYDLNRNHVILSEPETRLLHQIFNQHRPEVTLDVHEYGFSSWLHQGYIKDFGEQIDCISNPAIPAVLKEFS
ncbi:MAG: M14 family zinc carboxypeptidase, partial [bacterium]|nr:M14 family zinc carboxypeptidase [bacterium]